MTDSTRPTGFRPGRKMFYVLAAAVLAAGAVGLVLSLRPHQTTNTADPTQMPGTASTTLGSLRIYNAYIPAAASPDVAAGYFTITNSGDQPDTLVKVTSPQAASVQIHQTIDSGGASTMVEVPSLDVPAHGTMALKVGHRHLMLMKPTSKFREGDSVQLTLWFQRAGDVTFTVPVLAMTGPADTPMPGMSGMSDMPGMGG